MNQLGKPQALILKQTKTAPFRVQGTSATVHRAAVARLRRGPACDLGPAGPGARAGQPRLRPRFLLKKRLLFIFDQGKDNLNVNLSPNHILELTRFTALKTLHLLT